jgi:hypothetical protein
MKFFFRLILLLMPICIFVKSGEAQLIDIDGLIKKFDEYRSQTFQEKIYIHLDRPSYIVGETAWFKIYLTDGYSHFPSELSKVAYLEFLDKYNVSVLQTKVEVKQGFATGSLYLPPTLNSGNYTVRAYTNWMKNYSAEFYSTKIVSIVNTFKTFDPDKKKSDASYEIQFFPEGGNLIEGVKNNVAFKVADTNGNGVTIDGLVFNQQNDTIAKFKPHRFGIGRFDFTPQHNQQYHATMRDSNGNIHNSKLPPISSKGYSMAVIENSDGQLKILVNAVIPDSIAIKGVYMFLHSRNTIEAASFQILSNGSASFLVNTSSLKEGISHITIFDASKKPVCERLYFKQPQNNLDIGISLDQTQYGGRKLVKIDLAAIAKGERTESNLSISVFKTDSIPTFNERIESYFWLTSDLNGTIESPEFYLQSTPEVKIAVDNLMLTHGWRRFKWSDVLSDKKKIDSFVPEYRGHIIRGSVMSKDGSAADGIDTYLSTPGGATRFYPSRSSKTGDVFFEIQNLNEYSKIHVQTNSKFDTIYTISIKSPFSSYFDLRPNPSFNLPPSLKNQLVSRSISMQVQSIYSNNQNTKIKQSVVDTSSFYGKADETYMLDAFTRFSVMEEVMREYVKGVLVRKRKEGFNFIVLDNARKSSFRDTPLMLLDGIPIFDENEIMAINPLKIKKIEVMTRRWYLGYINFPGIVSLFTYGGGLGGLQLNTKGITLNYEGLQSQREFYSPKYQEKKELESRLPDQRYLLFWNPTIITGKDGKSKLEFYTSDVPGDYKIVVEGITKNGIVGSATATFKVDK